MPLSDITVDAEDDNSRILINLAIIISIMLFLCYAVPYIYKMFEDSTVNAITGEEEMYTTTKQNEIKNSWDIVDEVKNIRKKQKKNINNMSQSSSYGI